MHKEYKRIVKNSKKAVLFVHGFAGTPNHFGAFVELVPQDISVYNILLDGHGKSVKDFANASISQWKENVTHAVNELAETHDEICVVAHSLGCLLSIEQALNNAKISKMFLLAVPIKLFLKPKMYSISKKVQHNKIDPTNEELVAAKNCYSIEPDKNIFHYIGWIPRFLELFSEISKVRKMLPLINIPCEIYQSLNDELVSKNSINILKQNYGLSVTQLQNSGHFYYKKGDLELLKNNFVEFIS